MREMPPGDHCDPGERGHGAGGRRGNSRHGGRLGNSNNRDSGDVMRKILLLLALCATAAAGQQDLCDFTAEADAADIDGLELLMGDPADSCEGYSVSFANFQAALAISIANLTSGTNTTGALLIGTGASLKISGSGTIDGSALDADGDGNRDVYKTTVSGNPAVCFNAIDGASGCAGFIDDTGGGSRIWMDAAFFGEYVFLGPVKTSAASAWLLRSVSATRLIVNNATGGDVAEFGYDGTRRYVDMAGVRHYGAIATAPTCSADGVTYTDTDDGGGNAAHCVCLDGAWAKTVGAGACA